MIRPVEILDLIDNHNQTRPLWFLEEAIKRQREIMEELEQLPPAPPGAPDVVGISQQVLEFLEEEHAIRSLTEPLLEGYENN